MAPTLNIQSQQLFAASDPYFVKYGPRGGLGPFAGWLGEPSKFGFAIQDDCDFWLPGTDEGGNVHMFLIGAKDHWLYDWNAVAQRKSSGSQSAVSRFLDIEKATVAVAGFGGDYNDVAKYGPWTTFIRLANENPPRFTKSIGDIPGLNELGPATPTEDWKSNRMIVGVTFGQSFGAEAWLNPSLRIGVVTGFPGETCGGDCVALPIAEQIGEILQAVLGIVSGQYGLALSATKETIDTWTTYYNGIKRYDNLETAAKFLLEKASYQFGNCGKADSNRYGTDWITYLKGLL